MDSKVQKNYALIHQNFPFHQISSELIVQTTKYTSGGCMEVKVIAWESAELEINHLQPLI
jgi:hypothetical protein